MMKSSQDVDERGGGGNFNKISFRHQHPHECRQRGLGGVHQLVDGFFFFLMSYIISA